MASFCEWTAENVPDDPDLEKFAQTVHDGLNRIKVALPAIA
jgi:hypothetical protein